MQIKTNKCSNKLATEDLLSAALGAGAHDGHYELATHIEHAIAKALQCGRSCTDLDKCFDRILREIIIPAGVMAGLPIKILKTYMAFLRTITIYHDYALGRGKPRNRPASIPQGCPYSMRFLALIIAPLTVPMRVQGTIPRAPADDLTTIPIGHDACETTTAALYATYEYLNAFGGKVRIQKTWRLHRTQPSANDWPPSNLDLVVAHGHRDLWGAP